MARLSMTRGDDRTLRLTVDDDDGNPMTWAGVKAWFTLKRQFSDTDENALAARNSDDDLNEFDMSTDGTMLVEIKGTDTASLPHSKTHQTIRYDVQIRTVDGRIWTIDGGEIRIYPEVTRAA